MIETTRSKVLKAIAIIMTSANVCRRKPLRQKLAIFLIIAAIIIAVSEWRIRHNPIVTPGWPIDIYIINNNGHGLNFTQRNTYGTTLYYTYGFRIYRYEADEWKLAYTQPGQNVRRIRPNTIRNNLVQWGRSPLPEGQYRFARDFFLTPRTTSVYKTLYADFDVVCEQTLSDQQEQYHLSGDASSWRKDYIAFVTAGASSRAIVPAGRVQVSRTAIAFTSRNRSFRGFSHGDMWELAHYADGAWLPVPFVPIDGFWLPLSGGIGVLPRFWWLDTIQFHFAHGELPPGRYMFIRRHFRFNDDSGGRYFDYEYMMFEFVIRESTPVYLPGIAGRRALISAIVSGVIVRAGFFVAVAMLFVFLKRVYNGTSFKHE